jgi:hypothetical protein
VVFKKVALSFGMALPQTKRNEVRMSKLEDWEKMYMELGEATDIIDSLSDFVCWYAPSSASTAELLKRAKRFYAAHHECLEHYMNMDGK